MGATNRRLGSTTDPRLSGAVTRTVGSADAMETDVFKDEGPIEPGLMKGMVSAR
jgi:hypothetical protein